MKILRGGSENFKMPERGAPKICILQNHKKGGGLLKKGTASEGGLLKF